MKKIIQMMTALLLSSLLVACGGGGGSETGATGTGNTTVVVNPNASYGELVIDNGRGVTNNQDTERVK